MRIIYEECPFCQSYMTRDKTRNLMDYCSNHYCGFLKEAVMLSRNLEEYYTNASKEYVNILISNTKPLGEK